jgi:cold shock CspA family protein
MISCRVVVERANSRHNTGDLYSTRIFIALPGGKEVAVTKAQGDKHAHEDVLVAIRDAFQAARRQLEDYARIMRGDVKTHDGPPEGRVARFLAERSAGFIETDDGREIYFHRNSVVEGDFDALEIGDRVRFHEGLGADGPQASTVTPLATPRRA